MKVPVSFPPIILASHSPRRAELMRQAGLPFTVRLAGNADELYPSNLQREEIPLYLAKLKAKAFVKNELIPDNAVLVTADTIVWIDNRVLEKPANRQQAIEMLEILSDNMHSVYTGVCLTSKHKQQCFYDESKVFFRKLSLEEIEYYVDTFEPYDKAGAYGIQEWIGCTGIEKIEGSYHNIVGLPIAKLYQKLKFWGIH